MRCSFPTICCATTALLACAATLPARAAGMSCESLAKVTIVNVNINSSVEVRAGEFNPHGVVRPGDPPGPVLRVPAFCRVSGVARPTRDSIINFEIWLPNPTRWNKKFQGVGNGGYIGSISYGAMDNAVNRGYATASTDTGHSGDDLRFAAGHPEKITDWGYRAIHLTAETAKLVLRDYYGQSAQHSYFNGCSTGGSQALSEAERFPDDYDGILAGDAGNDRVHLNVGFLWAYAASHKEGKLILPESKLPLIHKAAVAACDKIDGLEDGIAENPLACHFDPATLLCKGADEDDCLTGVQVEAVKEIYAGPRNPRTGKRIIAGWAPGSEMVDGGDYAGWRNYLLSGDEPARTDFWKYFVFDDPKWDWRSFDFDHDVAYADEKAAAVNASSADLRAFKDHGGKILMYHGWVDPVGPPQDAIDYYGNVESAMGGPSQTHSFFRLFLSPGMSHCNGGPGYMLAGGARAGDDPKNTPQALSLDPEHDMLEALDLWVTKGKAPSRMIATRRMTHGEIRTIPVCAFPAIPELRKGGNPLDSSGYVCTAPSNSRGVRAGHM